MRPIGVALVMVLAGCGGVKLVQRDGCWVRQSKSWIGHTYEEIGPCEPPRTEWSDDRLTRVVQECVARTDYHWQTRALIAWNKGQPLPERAAEATVLQDCMDETSRALANDNDRLKQQNDLLSQRLGETSKERDALRTRADEASTRLLTSHERLSERLLGDQEKLGAGVISSQAKLAEYLGEAARKASQPAVATASATSSSDGAVTTDSSNAAAPSAPAAVVATVPVPTAPTSPVATTSARRADRASRETRRRAVGAAAPKSCAEDPAPHQERSAKGPVKAAPPVEAAAAPK